MLPGMDVDYPLENNGLSDDEFYFFDDDDEYDDLVGFPEQQSLSSVYEHCVVPVWSQIVAQMGPLVLYALLARLAISMGMIPRWLRHLGLAVLGGMSCYHLFGDNALWIFMPTLVFYPVCRVAVAYGQAVPIIVGATTAYVLACEVFLMERERWHQLRGPQMVISMKLISLAVDSSVPGLGGFPAPFELAGYLFNPGTVIFGPWMTFAEYSQMFHEAPVLWQLYRHGVAVLRVLICAILSLTCLMYSTCGSTWIIPDSSHMWLLAYRDAQSFRFSHYFVMFTAMVTRLTQDPVSGDRDFTLDVRPWHLELPRSLVQGVISWNLPMHRWLKNFVFKQVRFAGNFVAILVTYGASSLLHGLNFQLAAVLFSLGFYTYSEHQLRQKLADALGMCIQARPCADDCGHPSKSGVGILLVNGLFTGLAVFHLAYLGLLFDSSSSSQQEQGFSMWHTLTTWRRLGFASHWVALVTFLVQYLL